MHQITKERGSVLQGSESWSLLQSSISQYAPSKVFVLTDTNTKTHCLAHFLTQMNFEKEPEVLEISAGESNKTLHTCLELWQTLSDLGADRGSMLINLGGGVVTDLGGFVASAFKRGIEFVNIPTSLLAMVDASVGGKNGVDLGTLKNQIGIIRDPSIVLVDTFFLETLPENEFLSGMTEMLKHGLITTSGHWDALKGFSIASPKLKETVWESIEIKNNIVTQDPFEKGIRKTLNYGHTLGHAIESYCLENPNRRSLLHGEAIAIGLVLETFISSELLGYPKNKLEEVRSTVNQLFDKEEFNTSEMEQIIDLLVHDKKNKNGKVLFVLLEDIGRPKINCEVPNELIFKSFEYYHS